VGAFPDVFSSANSRFKGTESRSEPRIRFRLATGEFGNYWCMGRETNTQRIYKWQLEASTDDVNFVTLFLAPNPTYLGNEVQQFEVETVHKYNCYRLFCLEAEPSNPGLSYMQLFIYINETNC